MLVCAAVLAGCGASPAGKAAIGGKGATAAAPPPPAVTVPAPQASASPEPVQFSDGIQVGRALALTEAAIRSPDTVADRLAQLGRTQQIAYRTLVANPAWRGPALAQIPAGLRGAARANIEAGAELAALTKPGTTLPAWLIVPPPPAGELLSYYKLAEAQFGIGWQYLAAIHLIESRMGRIRGESTAGAQGPMQFLPQTWARYGKGDINDPREAVLAAGRYLKAAGAPQDMARALFAYNRSRRYVNAVTIYARQMMDDERAFLGYYNWQVFYRMPQADVELSVGYGSKQDKGA